MYRRTKIMATLGPATDDVTVREEMIAAGLDLIRINFSHGELAEHQSRIEAMRTCAEAHERHVGVLADLQGPKIRIGRFADGPVTLRSGAAFTLDAAWPSTAGDRHNVWVDYKQLAADVEAGDILLLDDGRIELEVTGITGDRVDCAVVTGGRLSDNKGINRKGGGLSADALTDKDRAALQARG